MAPKSRESPSHTRMNSKRGPNISARWPSSALAIQHGRAKTYPKPKNRMQISEDRSGPVGKHKVRGRAPSPEMKRENRVQKRTYRQNEAIANDTPIPECTVVRMETNCISKLRLEETIPDLMSDEQQNMTDLPMDVQEAQQADPEPIPEAETHLNGTKRT
ncbi:hypothetical protein MMC30_003921 [Trapelia coarctata]|nr:hypothetical protein [Trapelia coarctata]